MSTEKMKKQTILICVVILGALFPLFVLLIISRYLGYSSLEIMYSPDNIPVTQTSFSITEQLLICITAFGVKPLYELIAIIIVIKTWKDKDPGITALRYGLLAFFIGENCCALNYLLFNEGSFTLEHLHLYGMLLCFSFFMYSVLISLDQKILHYSLTDKPCRLQYFCKHCYKYSPVPCTITRIYKMFSVAMIVVTLLPVSTKLGSYFVAGDVFGSNVIFGHSIAQQLLETKIYPAFSILFFAASWSILYLEKEKGLKKAKIALSLGLGSIGFSFMRFIVFWGFDQNPIWANIWEETTELVFIFAVFYFLFIARSKPKFQET